METLTSLTPHVFLTYYSNEDDDDERDIEGNPIRNIFEIIEDVV